MLLLEVAISVNQDRSTSCESGMSRSHDTKTVWCTICVDEPLSYLMPLFLPAPDPEHYT